MVRSSSNNTTENLKKEMSSSKNEGSLTNLMHITKPSAAVNDEAKVFQDPISALQQKVTQTGKKAAEFVSKELTGNTSNISGNQQ